MVLWKQGDSRINLAAQPLGAQASDGSIPITTMSRWATRAPRPGLAASLNGDFFTYTSNWSSAYPSGLIVHRGAVLDFAGASDEQEAGYAPGGRVVIGTPRAIPERLLLPTGSSLTITPSRSWMMRRVCLAISCSCVTKTMVIPCSRFRR